MTRAMFIGMHLSIKNARVFFTMYAKTYGHVFSIDVHCTLIVCHLNVMTVSEYEVNSGWFNFNTIYIDYQI